MAEYKYAPEVFFGILEAKLGKKYTAEQVEFMRDFTVPVLSESKPGTGKTTAVVAGLINAELNMQIKGESITALSFTREATLELKQRHEEAIKKLGMQKQYIQFKTLHAMCRKILMDNHELLGMETVNIGKALSMAERIEHIVNTAAEEKIPINKSKARDIVKAIENLNSSLIFEKGHVESKYCFKKCGIPFDDFTLLRKRAYRLNKIMEIVQVSDILLYTLELLLTHPEVSAKEKESRAILVFDEFQDASLLHLKLVNMLAANVIAVGDINQQIYAFNGACQEIVQKFREYYPNYKEVPFTQSFRCSQEICDYSMEIIKANGNTNVGFKGTTVPGRVIFENHTDLKGIVQDIYTKFKENNNTFKVDTMFLFRNNMLAIPLAEEMYKCREWDPVEKRFRNEMPFRINGYKPAYEIDIIKDLCAICNIVRSPREVSNLGILNKLLVEYAGYRAPSEMPVYKVMTKKRCDFFEAMNQIKFNADRNAGEVMEMFLKVDEAYKLKATTRDLFNLIYPLYNAVWLKKNAYRLEQEPTHYINLVVPLIADKNYDKFLEDEIKKAEFINGCVKKREGIRNYTLHGAKGLEAPVVYILCAEEALIPNQKELTETLKYNCMLDAAKNIRNERSLIHVGVTRAMYEVHISYDNQLASLFGRLKENGDIDTSNNIYEELDETYARNKEFFNDVESFIDFTTDEGVMVRDEIDEQPNPDGVSIMASVVNNFDGMTFED